MSDNSDSGSSWEANVPTALVLHYMEVTAANQVEIKSNKENLEPGASPSNIHRLLPFINLSYMYPIRWFVLDQPVTLVRPHKYVYLVGASSEMVMNIINAFINYILGLEHIQPIRFCAFQESDPICNIAKNCPTAYTVNYELEMKIEFGVTFIGAVLDPTSPRSINATLKYIKDLLSPETPTLRKPENNINTFCFISDQESDPIRLNSLQNESFSLLFKDFDLVTEHGQLVDCNSLRLIINDRAIEEDVRFISRDDVENVDGGQFIFTSQDVIRYIKVASSEVLNTAVGTDSHAFYTTYVKFRAFFKMVSDMPSVHSLEKENETP